MFQLDLGPHGGSTVWRRTEAFELLKSEEISTVDVDWWRSQINEEWMKERTPSKVHELLKDAFGDSDLIGGSIESIARNSAALERESALASQPRQKYRLELRRELDQEIIERTTHRVFTYLCTVERELSYIGVNAAIFERHRLRVESFLSQISPRVLEQFTAVYRRAREDDAESKTHALTTCRRILESVADVVFRLRQNQPWIQRESPGRSDRRTTSTACGCFWMHPCQQAPTPSSCSPHSKTSAPASTRFYSLTNKGVHSNVAQAEVDTCVMQTYLLAGEILQIFQDSSKSDPSESAPMLADLGG